MIRPRPWRRVSGGGWGASGVRETCGMHSSNPGEEDANLSDSHRGQGPEEGSKVRGLLTLERPASETRHTGDQREGRDAGRVAAG